MLITFVDITDRRHWKVAKLRDKNDAVEFVIVGGIADVVASQRAQPLSLRVTNSKPKF